MSAEDWQVVRLNDLGRIITGKTPSSKRPELFGDVYPFITPTEMGYGQRSAQAVRFLSDKGAAAQRSLLLPKGTVSFVCIASIGKACLVREPSFTNQQVNSIIVDADRHSPEFIYYLLVSEQERIKRFASGAATPIINKGDFGRIEVAVPSLPTQQRIAAILSAYDDLIETNTRRIAILEEMARRLYEEWFVHFRFPGHEGVEFDGDLPRGWRMVTLDDVASVNPESIKPKSAPARVCYIDIASVSPGRIDSVQELAFTDAPGRARRIVRDGDVIWSCVRPNRRSFALVHDPADDTVASTGFAVLRAFAVPFFYLYCATTADAFVDYLTTNATGAAYPAVKQSDFERADVLLPSAPVLAAFDQAVQPMLRLCDGLQRKNTNLRAQRDLILPKLVSGEIDVSGAEAPLEAAE